MMLKLLIILITISCNQHSALENCDELSMKKYKGIPNAYQNFEKGCQGAKIKYTEEVCQKALLELIKTKSLLQVKENFGDPIKNCFTENDLRNFTNNQDQSP